jgi:hypothetical protein
MHPLAKLLVAGLVLDLINESAPKTTIVVPLVVNPCVSAQVKRDVAPSCVNDAGHSVDVIVRPNVRPRRLLPLYAILYNYPST